jgi:hypothetical protein
VTDLPNPQQAVRPSAPDGRMSREFWLYLLALHAYIKALEARIAALE